MVWSLFDKLRLTNNGDGFTSAPSHRTTYSGSSRVRDHDGRDCDGAARLQVETCSGLGIRPGFRRVNEDVQFHEESAHFSDRRQGQLLDVIGLCATMNDEPVLQDFDANARDTTVRSLVNPAFEIACDRLVVVSRLRYRVACCPALR